VPVASSQQFQRPRRSEPLIITEAAPSLIDQQAARKRRYAITMGVRSVALILAAVFYQTVWLMVILAFLGTVLPWIAVVMANDRPPKNKTRLPGVAARPDRVLENPRSGRVIEG
jgi:hypothetical protein